MSIVDTTKDVYELIKKGADLEMQEKLMKLREEALAVQEENIALHDRVRELEAQKELAEQVEFDGHLYWRVIDGERDGPYCQQCLDSDVKLIRLQKSGGGEWGTYWYDCHTCKSRFDPL